MSCRARCGTIAGAVAVAAALAQPSAAAVGDPLAPHQWALSEIAAPEAWALSTGAGAVIAVVDSGVDLAHQDLFVGSPDNPAANEKLLAGATFLSCGEDGCGDGDYRMPGADRGHPHGTHVAGIAAAATGNGIGIAGVAPDARILPVRVLHSQNTGTYRDVAYGVRWAAEQGADVINLSLSGGLLPELLGVAGLDEGVTEAVSYASSRGVVVVAAAGNDSHPYCSSPAFREDVVCVVATNRAGQRASYSNYAISRGRLAVAAPGGEYGDCAAGVLSTVPFDRGSSTCGYPADRDYGEMFGSSMATPHVAGVAALLTSMGCGRAQIIDLLTSTARTPGSDDRGTWGPVYGYGIVDANAAVQAALALCEGAGSAG